jgi:hypothetical protein
MHLFKVQALIVHRVYFLSSSLPKRRFYTRINESDYLGLTIWHGKSDPDAEVVVVSFVIEKGTAGRQ